MDYITTTQLRTQSKALVSALKSGKEVKLVHRSSVIGSINPLSTSQTSLNPNPNQNQKALLKALDELSQKLPDLTYEEREHNYRTHLEEKYGRHLPGRK